LAVVMLVHAGTTPVSVNAAVPPHRWLVPRSGSPFNSLVCPSPLQWVRGEHDNFCGDVVRRQSGLSVLYLACGLIGAELAVLAGRRRKRQAASWLRPAAEDGRVIAYMEPPEALKARVRDWWRARSRRGRLQTTWTIVGVGTLVLAVAAVTWHPWTPYPKVTRATWDSRGDNSAAGMCAPIPALAAFGHLWKGDTPFPPGVVPTATEAGTFRQVDATHGVFVPAGSSAHYSFTWSNFNDLDCPAEPFDPLRAEKAPMASQPPDPCKLLTATAIAAAFGRHASGPAQQSAFATLGNGRECQWTINSPAGQVRVELTILTSTNIAAAQAAGLKTMPLPDYFAMQARPNNGPVEQSEVLGHPAVYQDRYRWLYVLTPTALIAIDDNYPLPDNEATLSELAALAIQRVDSTGP
jgi:hypothetical protein